jgi:periplasmic mercuric ion binding protein
MVKKLLLITVVFASLTACKNNSEPELKTVDTVSADLTANTVASDPKINYAKAEFGIEGMTCEIGCARTIEKKIAKMEGVKYAKVDFNKKMAMVEYDPSKVTPTSLEETVTKVGEVYKVKDMKTVEEFSKE